MKKFVWTLLLIGAFTACKKETTETETIIPILNVDVIVIDSTATMKTFTLKWETNCRYCLCNSDTLDKKGVIPFIKVKKDSTKIFNFCAFNKESEKLEKKIVVVFNPLPIVPPPLPLPTINVSANPDTLPIGGGITTITWTTQDADSVGFAGNWYDPNSSVETGFIPASSSLSFIAKGKGGETTTIVSITVALPTPPPTMEELLCAETRTLFYKEYAYTIYGPRILIFSYTPNIPPTDIETWKFSLPDSLTVTYGSQQTFHNWFLNDSIIQGFGDRFIKTLTPDTLRWLQQTSEYQGDTIIPTFTWSTYVKL